MLTRRTFFPQLSNKEKEKKLWNISSDLFRSKYNPVKDEIIDEDSLDLMSKEIILSTFR